MSHRFHHCTLASNQQVPVSCPGPTELGLTHCPRRPHASRQLPKDDKPPYWVEKGHCNDGPRQKRATTGTQVQQELRLLDSKLGLAGSKFQPTLWTWLQINSMCLGQGHSWDQYLGGATPLYGFTSGNVSGSQLHHCHVLSPRIQERGTGSGSPMQPTQVILGNIHNSPRGGNKESWGVVPLPLAESQLALPTSSPCLPAQGRVRFTCGLAAGVRPGYQRITKQGQRNARSVGRRLSLGKLYVVSMRVLTSLISASNL